MTADYERWKLLDGATSPEYLMFVCNKVFVDDTGRDKWKSLNGKSDSEHDGLVFELANGSSTGLRVKIQLVATEEGSMHPLISYANEPRGWRLPHHDVLRRVCDRLNAEIG